MIDKKVKTALEFLQIEMRKQLDEIEQKLSNIVFNEHDANWGHVGSAAQAVKELQNINEFLS
jgi:hypothetical protein